MANALDINFQLYVDGAWVTYPGYSADGWGIRIGPDDQQNTLQANTIRFTLQNDDYSMDPSNYASTLYGKIGRNTPCRIRLGTAVLTYAEASEWQPEQTEDHSPGPAGRGRAHVDVKAGGLLQRLGRWEDELRSAMYTQISSYSSLLGYLPLEDQSGALVLAQYVAGVPAGRKSGTVNLAADDGPGGSDSTVTVGLGGKIGGVFKASTASGWQFSISLKLPALPGSASLGNMFTILDTLGRTWMWQINNTDFRIAVIDSDGSTVLKTSSAVWSSGTTPTEWIRYRLKVTVSAGTISLEPAWYGQDDATAVGFSDTFSAASTGQPKSWEAIGINYTDGAAFGHAFAVSSTSLDLVTSGDARNVFNGWLGEKPLDRYYRIMTQLGLTAYVAGTGALGAPMGRQKPGRVIDYLQEIVDTDGGEIYDEPLDTPAVSMRSIDNLLNQSPALTLVYGTHIAPPLKKQIGDLGVKNDITAANSDGSSVRVEQTTGRLSTAPPPAGAGRYKGKLDVNLSNPGALSNRASWELAQGTLERPRYRVIRVAMHKHTSLRAAVTALRPGHIIKITGLEGDPVYLRMKTMEREGNATEDWATFTCLPADILMSGTFNDGVSRVDSGSSILMGALTSGATSCRVGTWNPGDVWSDTDEPYDVWLAGERCTVTAMTVPDSDASIAVGTFEAGVTGWDATSCTLTQSAVFAHGGTKSGLITVVGSPATAFYSEAVANRPRVVPGMSYTVAVWCRSTATLTDVRVFADWLDSAGALISSSDSGLASLTSGSFVQRTVTATAPAGAVTMRRGAVIRSSPTAGTLLYTDDFTATSATVKYQTATLTRAVNGIVKAQTAGTDFIAAARGYVTM